MQATSALRVLSSAIPLAFTSSVYLAEVLSLQPSTYEWSEMTRWSRTGRSPDSRLSCLGIMEGPYFVLVMVDLGKEFLAALR